MKLSMAEITEAAVNQPTKDEKIVYLRKNYDKMYAQMLKMAFDPNLAWDLPVTDPPYKKTSFDDSEGMLFSEVRRMYLFHVGGHPTLKQDRKQQLFVELLETVGDKDAEFVLAVRNKKLPEKYGITKELVDEAYPGLLVY
jgi:Family of unknown function (DUF6433)